MDDQGCTQVVVFPMYLEKPLTCSYYYEFQEYTMSHNTSALLQRKQGDVQLHESLTASFDHICLGELY